MKVITSHINLDFDGIASMVACSKLYPEGILVFSGKLNNDVKEFFGLYKNVLSIKSANEIDIKEIKDLIIVDTNTANRIGKFKDAMENLKTITIFDHHMETELSIKHATHKTIKPYGSCTAILVEEIRRNKIEISSFDATLFILGIYADTNCLTFTSTTAEDVETVAYLLKKGGDLNIVSTYIQKSLTNQHDQLFLSLLLNMESIEVNSYKIIITVYSQDHYLGELGYIANKMLEIKDCDAVFLIVQMVNRCYIVGRSLHNNIIIPDILENFNGAGHASAASAVVKDGNPNEIRDILLDSLFHRIKPQTTAKDIMNYPVKTVIEDMTVEEVNKIMLRYGHTGMPVVKDNKLIGIISRTDVDKAIQHGLSHAPVKGFMTREVQTINLGTSINEINNLLVKHNIGRLPVVENNIIVGIVTRTDLLRMLHGEKHPYWYKKTFHETKDAMNCIQKLEALPEDISQLLITTGAAGDLLGKNVFVVGGFVRDLLLEKKNLDIDLVIEGDGILFAEKLNKTLGGKLLSHSEFGTATIILDNDTTLDIVSARREYYEYPAALPKVEKSSLWNDLFRRDFTINCMAIQINSNGFGKLIDYFGGLEDVQNRKIRVLHNMSFIEDPTRIFRAIRFASRLNFEIDRETNNFIIEAIKGNMLSKVTDDRIREEFIHIIEDENISMSISLMNSLNIFKAMHSSLMITDDTIHKLSNIDSSAKEFSRFSNGSIDKRELIITQLLHNIPINKLSEVICKFINYRIIMTNVEMALQHKENVYNILMKEDVDKLTLHTILSQHSLENLIFYYNDCHNSYIKHYIMYYMLNLKNVKISITGKDLLDLNIKPGPIYKRILDETLKAKVLGKIYDKTDEIRYAVELYEKIKGEDDV
ncbi:tRNA nucleotidyltransferase (CCA-adding enzyme) [Anaerovirgula multivorans]|uniref:tRNA nucleotidyltransferase (CCA-adding enzyme) n=1 Tax=Anaerovirgula multivorans TaxID=312168 RepID=A0A238ZUS5_9FIRM|nr:CBS domain-containing protein [Anaerovirgula multivorans]SNR87176.1 tRNA nucleotidyltransferase (CCA-adding enzyme) [Anaerovirgula multivorans]